MGRQPVILHVPFVTDVSTSHLQHVWPYCTRTQHWIVHNVLRLSKHDDGETSNKYQSSCRDYMLSFWVIGLWEGSVWVLRVLSVTASASFDPTNRSDLTQLFSIVSCLTAKSIWVKKKKTISLTIQTQQHFRELHWSSLQMLPTLALSWQATSGGRANNDCPFLEGKADAAWHCCTDATPLSKEGRVDGVDNSQHWFLLIMTK